MIATAEKQNVGFVPVVLTLTLDTQQEVDTLFNLFNTDAVSDSIQKQSDLRSAIIRDSLRPFIKHASSATKLDDITWR